ncbi:hypothetical protein F3Y22_tig00116951pilonHSYRG00265 [Hibiscus syriacus]|uniref:Ankyrin repeat domain-containing protein n=1 Tax=Hibiscus syriacus TaxID=106335 RepID=A0A6A2WKY6_HIBSY|nr:hypothetical protein F3Y22_tig00116951pilonHSYRG00265 [Hibiscus syriacus]
MVGIDVSKYAHSPVHKTVATRDYESLRRILEALPRLGNADEIRTEAISLAEEAKAEDFASVIDKLDVPEIPLFTWLLNSVMKLQLKCLWLLAVLLPQLTWRRQEKTEMVGAWKAKVYDMHNVVVSIKSRRVHGATTVAISNVVSHHHRAFITPQGSKSEELKKGFSLL